MSIYYHCGRCRCTPVTSSTASVPLIPVQIAPLPPAPPPVVIVGPPGPRGPQGPQGATGPAGTMPESALLVRRAENITLADTPNGVPIGFPLLILNRHFTINSPTSATSDEGGYYFVSYAVDVSAPLGTNLRTSIVVGNNISSWLDTTGVAGETLRNEGIVQLPAGEPLQLFIYSGSPATLTITNAVLNAYKFSNF